MKSELANRFLYGIIIAAIGFVVVYQGGYIFFSAVMVISFIISLEFDNLRKDGKVSFLFAALPILFSFHPEIALALTLIAVISISLFDMVLKTNNPWLTISIPYITIPAISIIWLRNLPNGWHLCLWIVLIITATDISAYFCGKAFGKHLLAPKISPKKTWEGLIGGALIAMIVSYIYTGKLTYSLLALVFAFVGQLSDLLESSIKRYFGVKDTGKILPGHGGAMDRLDAFVLTVPLAAIFAYCGILAW